MKPFLEVIQEVTKKDSRYDREAYLFVLQGLDFTRERMKLEEEQRHVTGPELLEGLRGFALEQFGPMASTVFRSWGVFRTDDFGHIVFNMVDAGIMNKTEDDSLDHFVGVFDFDEALPGTVDVDELHLDWPPLTLKPVKVDSD